MSDKIIDARKVRRITNLIERQIQLRVEQLATFVELKKSIEKRDFHGQLHQSDIEHIEKVLAQMPRIAIEEVAQRIRDSALGETLSEVEVMALARQVAPCCEEKPDASDA